MPEQHIQWQIQPPAQPPEWFIQEIRRHAPDISGHYAGQLLWQRGIRDRQQLAGFLNPNSVQPASPFEFGQEMRWAVERLLAARRAGEKVAIWGDFDADGITATATLWEGLGQFFPQHLSRPQQHSLIKATDDKYLFLFAALDWLKHRLFQLLGPFPA